MDRGDDLGPTTCCWQGWVARFPPSLTTNSYQPTSLPASWETAASTYLVLCSARWTIHQGARIGCNPGRSGVRGAVYGVHRIRNLHSRIPGSAHPGPCIMLGLSGYDDWLNVGPGYLTQPLVSRRTDKGCVCAPLPCGHSGDAPKIPRRGALTADWMVHEPLAWRNQVSDQPVTMQSLVKPSSPRRRRQLRSQVPTVSVLFHVESPVGPIPQHAE